jgi:hypothetical protein
MSNSLLLSAYYLGWHLQVGDRELGIMTYIFFWNADAEMNQTPFYDMI